MKHDFDKFKLLQYCTNESCKYYNQHWFGQHMHTKLKKQSGILQRLQKSLGDSQGHLFL